MEGILNTSNFTGGQADLTNYIAKLGWNDTPLFSMIQKAVPAKTAKSYLGHAWQYETAPDGDDTNEHKEGSVPAAATTEVLGDSLNHYQIIKHTYGVTGSAEDLTRRDGELELSRQGALKAIAHRKTIEKQLFKGTAPVQRVGIEGDVGSVAGKMGGLGHWCTVNNTVTVTATAFSMKLLKEMFKMSFLNGVPMTHIFMNDFQKDALDDILDSKTRTGQGVKSLDANNIEFIKNIVYAPNVKVILSPYVAQGDIYGVSMPNLALVYQRLTKAYELSRTSDAVKKELISELTLRVNNPYGVTKLTGLTVS